MHLVRSDDGGKRFSAAVEIGAESEGVQTSVGMFHPFAVPNGDRGAFDGEE